jgi:hypothetical protein
VSFDLVRNLKGLNADLRGKLADLGGAKSPEMQAMGRIVRKSVAKTLSVAGGGKPSAPGEAPRAQSKKLARSVKMGVVGTGVRVGALRFTADFMESGVDARLGARKATGRRSLRSRSRVTKRTLRIQKRPYLQKSLDAVKDQLGTEFANVAGARIGKR